MSYLTDNPDLMLEALAILVKRAGGSVELAESETLGPYNLMSKFDGAAGKLFLVFESLDDPDLSDPEHPANSGPPDA
jgi:hypothetical protein